MECLSAVEQRGWVGGTMAGNRLRYNLRERLYISTVAEDDVQVAVRYGLGLELAEFCTASNMDGEFSTWDKIAREKMRQTDRLTFHGPFNELSTAAIEPLVLEVTARRYEQAYALARTYGIRRLIFHSTFIPTVYYPQWFVERSAEFWQHFLQDKPADLEVCVENVLDETPEILVNLVQAVDDPRLRLCLDLGHAHAFHSKVSAMEWVEATGPWLRHIHLHDNYGAWDVHNCLGDGTLPLKDLLDRLERLQPACTYTIENLHCEPSVIWLKENGYLGE
jgi:sugar phosphate isomerase/epimerase